MPLKVFLFQKKTNNNLILAIAKEKIVLGGSLAKVLRVLIRI
jgi:hypothetical protein